MIGTVRPSVGRSLPLAAQKTGATCIVLYQAGRSAGSPFLEPRAVASVPRTFVWLRSLPSFRNDESAISDSVRRPLATARGSE